MATIAAIINMGYGWHLKSPVRTNIYKAGAARQHNGWLIFDSIIFDGWLIFG